MTKLPYLVFGMLAIVATGVVALAPRLHASGNPTVTYTYDSLGRLVGDGYSNYTGANTSSYTYDNASNRTATSVH